MTWADLHKASEIAAIEAEQSFRKGNASGAAELYAKAAVLEEDALAAVDRTKIRTRGITAVSVVSLWYKAAVYDRAEQLAHASLADPSTPPFARGDLRNLIQAIWTESAKRAANVNFLAGHVFVSVKGGEVITGGAPLDLIVEKVQTIQAMFYRTVEFIKDMPVRLRGGPPRDIQDACRPWIFQAVPGSYQFSVAIQEAKQLDLFREDPRPDLVAHQFLEILRATVSEDTHQLEGIVPKPEYRNVFLELSRNLAPTGKRFGSIELSAGTGDTPVALTPEARAAINQTIRKARRGATQEPTEKDEEVVGTLRAVDLDKDFLDVVVDGHGLHIVGLGDAMDDVIGPMVNKVVKVQVVRGTRDSLRFRDIELEE
jgi:hypothetical protein